MAPRSATAQTPPIKQRDRLRSPGNAFLGMAVNPTIDFNNPAGGSYDIWIGSYAVNTTISGTLYLTENSGKHL